MKKIYDIDLNILKGKYSKIAQYDAIEIDNSNEYSINKIAYLNRLNKLAGLIDLLTERKGPSNVLDIGCAQGNLSLLLAEKGYIVDALDLRPEYIEYSKLKYEKGDIRWLNVNIMEFIPGKQYDFVILGEILEHCAYPERILEKAVSLLRIGGHLIATTPNGRFVKEKLPRFKDVSDDRASLEKRQYGPEGKDHLFLFTLKELTRLVSSYGTVVGAGYLGSYLVNRASIKGLKVFLSPARVQKLISLFESIPILNRLFSQGLYAVARK